MITAYFDAAYNQPKSTSEPEVHTVAAYLATESNWRKFRKEWKLELDKKGLEYLHMTDFEFAQSRAISGKDIPRKNLYHGWSKNEFIPFIKRLHRTLKRKSDGSPRLSSFASSVIKSDFDETIPEQLRKHPQCSSYYIFNVVTVIKSIALSDVIQNYDEKINYVFSFGDRENGNLMRLCKDIQENGFANYFRFNEDLCEDIFKFEKMKDESALQAADVLTYEQNKVAINSIQRDYPNFIAKEELRRKSLPALLAGTKNLGWIFNKNHLKLEFKDLMAGG